MYCNNCGKEIDDNAFVCPHCGVKTVSQRNEIVLVEDKKVNGLGIAGFVVSLVSLLLGFYMICSIVGLVLSIVGVCRRKKYTSCNGLAIAGLVIGCVSTVFWLIMLICVGSIIAMV